MSEKDQSQPSGHEQTHGDERARDERPDRGSRGPGGGGADRERHRGGGRRRHGGGGQPRPQQGQGRRPESSLDLEELRELAELFTSHGLTDFEFENADIRVRLSRSLAPAPTTHPAPPPTSHAQQHATHAPATTAQPSTGSATPAAEEAAPAQESAEDLHIITSPIVGTFYRSPSPNAEPFVKAGSHVEPDTVVCIIEAMKLMNEIQAEAAGTVEKIYVENGQPVEYGQPLFGLKK
jgi:acetyl-CoA carboxylase biotin carboxyl carrier protein